MFDLESNGLFEESSAAFIDQNCYCPEITCGVTYRMTRHAAARGFEVDDTVHWHGDLTTGEYMSGKNVVKLVEYMVRQRKAGYVPMGWNSVGFDFKLLYCCLLQRYDGPDKRQRLTELRELALCSVDPCFNFFMGRGFPVQMRRVAAGFNLPVNKSGDGAEAARMWIEGTKQDRLGIVRYCEQDVVVLTMIVSAIACSGEIRWLTKSTGKLAKFVPPANFKEMPLISCEKAMRLTPPDNSWMKNKAPMTASSIPNASIEPEPPRYTEPPTMTKFTGWLSSCHINSCCV